MKRVVVTGLGLITSIGTGYDESWNSLLQGKSGIKIIDHFDTEDLSCKIAGHLISSYDPSNHLETKEIKRNDRFIQYGIVAAKIAVEDSGISDLSEEDIQKILGVLSG